jgi:OmcA/MtrC family decaheme c-type cytochrome
MNESLITQGITRLLIASSLLLFTACGGGSGGGDSGGDSGGGVATSTATAPNGIDNSRPPVPYSDAEKIFPVITQAVIPEDGRAVVDFQLTDAFNTAILDLTAADIRGIIAKLQNSPIGNLTGNWQSYINSIETPGAGEWPSTEPKLQATTESGSDGELTNNGDGTYRYRFATILQQQASGELADQANREGLNLDYQDGLTHRVAMQFSNSQQPANPTYDWIPRNGQTDFIFHLDVAATANCNNCHDKLAFHGGGRVEIKYCVTCHNPGSTDANSGNSVDLKQMVHKIHMGSQLPSVQHGTDYIIWGFNDTAHNYSSVRYPGDILACERCHAGTASDPGDGSVQLTNQGDNWREYSQRTACGSCHDKEPDFFAQHFGGQTNDDNCMSCHGIGGAADTIANTHINPVTQAQQQIAAEILGVSESGQGETPTVSFRVFNPTDGSNYDILNDPIWTNASSSLNVTLGWSTTDYTNTGNGGDNASTVSVSAKTNATARGDGTFSVTFATPIPDTNTPPGIAATGSGAAVIEGKATVELSGESNSVPLTNAVDFFSIDEVDSSAQPRRQSAELNGCLNCHQNLVFHGSNRSNNLDSCVTCHNPRNTDLRQREGLEPPPSDGKREESIDFKTMVHGIHASAYREQPLQVAGFGGTLHTYDTTTVGYPGRLSNCLSCHNDNGFTLPLADTVLGTTFDTGALIDDPADDRVITPTAAVCSSCHDGASAQAHMVSAGSGGNFDTSQSNIDQGIDVEQCALCHGPGRSSDVSNVHSLVP